MDIRELKTYIYEQNYVEQILYSIGCHHIKYHMSKEYWTCGNADGDNKSAIVLYNTEQLFCTNYTRQMTDRNTGTDIIDLVAYQKKLNFVESLRFLCDTIGIDYYHDFNDDMPPSFQFLSLIDEMNTNSFSEDDKPLKPISESVLSYYKQYVNDLFADDGIDYYTQKEFEIGFDEESNRYTIPIRSEIGDLVGVKGRYFERKVPDDQSKYIYLEPCAKSKILYGLYKTIEYIKSSGVVYIFESEKAVLQLWSYGYRNAIATGGKEISQHQLDIIVRLGVKIVICFDKDVQKDEIEEIADRFPDGVPIYYIYDTNNILDEKESPSDNKDKWEQLRKNNLYKMR